MAESEGFEPPEAVNFNGFQDRRYRPLSQLSTVDILLRKLCFGRHFGRH